MRSFEEWALNSFSGFYLCWYLFPGQREAMDVVDEARLTAFIEKHL